MTVPLYEISKLRQVYGRHTVLNIDALNVAPGEILAVIGPNGAGKSTLLRLMALLETPTEGCLVLRLGERELTSQTATIQDHRRITMVFQSPVLLSRSVRANVAYGLRLRGLANHDERIDEILQQVALLGLAEAKTHTLSGGEAQRVALARALVLQPQILLLDEPTANLDPHHVRIIETLIQEQQTRRKTTVILVTHNLFQAKRLATRVALLLDGELVEVAPTQAFFETPADARTQAFISGDFVY